VKLHDIPAADREIPGSLLMWRHLSNRVYDYLDGISLAETVEIQKENTQSALFHSDLQKSAA
jgi:hypothetical protein